MRVYPLYPHAKRWLLCGVAFYLLFVCIYAYGAYRQYQHPEYSFVVFVGYASGLCALWGLVLCVHLMVLGTTPPEGMDPFVPKSYSNHSFSWWRRTSTNDEETTKGLAGDEAQPVVILFPVMAMFLITFLPAVVAFVIIVKAVELMTFQYVANPRALRPLRVMFVLYLLGVVAFGVLVHRTDVQSTYYFSELAALASCLLGVAETIRWYRKARTWKEGGVAVAKYSFAYGQRLRLSLCMNMAVFQAILPVGLVYAAVYIGLLVGGAPASDGQHARKNAVCWPSG